MVERQFQTNVLSVFVMKGVYSFITFNRNRELISTCWRSHRKNALANIHSGVPGGGGAGTKMDDGNGGPITDCLIHTVTKCSGFQDACVRFSFPV